MIKETSFQTISKNKTESNSCELKARKGKALATSICYNFLGCFSHVLSYLKSLSITIKINVKFWPTLKNSRKMKKCLSKWPKLIFARHFTLYFGNFFAVHANQYCLMSQSRVWKCHALCFLKDLSSVVSTCRKTVEMCTSCIGSPFAIFQMIWKLTIPSLSSWWFAVYYTAVEGVSSFESKVGKWNQPWGVTIETKASEQVRGVGDTPYDGLYG